MYTVYFDSLYLAPSDSKMFTIDDLFKKASLNSTQTTMSPEPVSLTSPDNPDEHYHAFKRLVFQYEHMSTIQDRSKGYTSFQLANFNAFKKWLHSMPKLVMG